VAASLFDITPEPPGEVVAWHQWIKADLALKRGDAILNEFGGPTEFFAAGEAAWRQFGCSEGERKRLSAIGPLSTEEHDLLTDPDLTIISNRSPAYPQLLRQAAGVPAAYYCRGIAPDPDTLCVAIAGTRHASPSGLSAAEFFARELARLGVTVVTGGSHGIEAMAIRAAADAGGQCVVALPCGPDSTYPEDHWRLFRTVSERGAVISTFPMGMRPLNPNYARRNRFIAAMSAAVLIVEAPRGSGSLTVANFANEDGRQVFVVPGSYTAPTFEGNHDLVRLGATLVTTPYQILDDIGQPYEKDPKPQPSAEMSPLEEKILAAIRPEPRRLDELVRLVGTPAPELAAGLTGLEIAGRLRRAAGGTFCLRN
jgi:DNA processing protein